MSRDLVGSMGTCQALMRLATDAVRAAAESPFLEGLGAQGTRALCCVSLPSGEPRSPHPLRLFLIRMSIR